jgi:hypothetical protein
MSTTARIRIRRDTAANFTSTNPTLALGEIAYETDTKRFKVGNGSTAWTSLAYAAESPVNLAVQGTGALTVPSGTFAQRPGTPAPGMIRHNTDSSRLEHYNGTAWQTFQPETLEVEYLVVAGGGGGGGSSTGGGGGGAGGFRTNVGGSLLSLASGTSYSVVVGAGGTSTGSAATTGSNSSFANIESAGGGCVATSGALGIDGGSGFGGSGEFSTNATIVGLGNVPATSPPQGNAGGIGFTYQGGGTVNRGAGGGGGGAGGNGSAAQIDVQAGNGGIGADSSITGSTVTYAGGGGGGYYAQSAGSPPCPGGTGGSGGGGDGAGTAASTAAVANTGGGGGGRGNDGVTTLFGKAGGSGIVIVRYLGAQRATGGTITAGTGSAAGYTIHTFTTSGTFALTA